MTDLAHILEKDEQLDYEAFYHVPGKGFPHGRTSSEDAGHAFWEVLHGLADAFPCPTCRPGAIVGASGFHDVVSIGLDKPWAPYDPEKFEAFVHGMVLPADAKFHRQHRHVKMKRHITIG